MGRFSLAVLFLVIAIAAIGLASIRSAFVHAGDENLSWLPLVAGSVSGAVFGFGLAVWSRWDALRVTAGTLGGFCLGAAAGAQSSVAVHWAVVFVAPILIVSLAGLIAINRRGTMRSRAQFLERTSNTTSGRTET
jgi:hypothetical protein